MILFRLDDVDLSSLDVAVSTIDQILGFAGVVVVVVVVVDDVDEVIPR